jgi:undecaprenyl-diphosphatase
VKRLFSFSYWSLHSIAGLILSSFFIWVFSEIAEGVSHKDIIVIIDQWIIKKVLMLRTTHLTMFMEFVTNLGGIIIIGPCTIIISAYLIIRKEFNSAVSLLVAISGGVILNNLLKLFFQRPRPIDESTLIEMSGWSFPSGHSMNSIIFYGILTYWIIKGLSPLWLKSAACIITCLIVFMIGISRIYLQVHYLSDVIAGFSCGLFWLSICVTGMEIDRKIREAIS